MAYRLTELAVELTTCTYCHAAPRRPCTVVKGRTAGQRASYTHSGRTDAVYAGWREGYSEGATEALAMLERILDRKEFGATVDYTELIATVRRQYV